MKNRYIVLGMLAAALAATAIWWANKPSPAPTVEKSASAAPAPAAPKPAASAIQPPKQTVASPVVAPAVAAPSATPPPAATTQQNIDPELKSSVDNLITVLENQDVNTFVDDYVVPGVPAMMQRAKESVLAQAAKQPNASPEQMAQAEQQMDQTMQQRMPDLIAQMKQQITQDPKAAQGFQKLATALKAAKDSPQMNAGGDQATFTLETGGDTNVPAQLVMVHSDGKWTLDISSMKNGGGN